jgi:hypothetical protein
MLDSQRLAIEATTQAQEAARVRAASAKRRRIGELLKRLAKDFGYMAFFPDSRYSDQTEWRITQLEKYAADEEFVETLDDKAAQALESAVHTCKGNFGHLKYFKREWPKATTEDGKQLVLDKSRQHAGYALRCLRALGEAMFDKEVLAAIECELETLGKLPSIPEDQLELARKRGASSTSQHVDCNAA